MSSGFLAGFSLALASAVVWAFAPVLYRRGVEQFSYTAFGAARTPGSILAAAAYLYFTMGGEAFTPPSLTLLLAIFASSVVWLVLGDLFYFVSLHRLGVTLGVPICSAYPLLAVPAAWIFLGEPASFVVEPLKRYVPGVVSVTVIPGLAPNVLGRPVTRGYRFASS